MILFTVAFSYLACLEHLFRKPGTFSSFRLGIFENDSCARISTKTTGPRLPERSENYNSLLD